MVLALPALARPSLPLLPTTMTALEAALAFADADKMDGDSCRDSLIALCPNRVPKERPFETALRILAAQVRADAAHRGAMIVKQTS